MALDKLLHEIARFNIKDEFFISGGNPDMNGGGVIGTAPTWMQAVNMKHDAMSQGYKGVRILTWNEVSN